MATDDPPSSEHPLADGIFLSEVAQRAGVSVGKLSTLAISGCFPSSMVGSNRRVVEPRVADALVVLFQAGLDGRTIIRTVLADPAGVAAAAAEVASILARPAPGSPGSEG